jgi:outer membrane lipoprotein-sorting protein
MRSWKKLVTKPLIFVLLTLIPMVLSSCSLSSTGSKAYGPSESYGQAFSLVQSLYQRGQSLETFAARGEATYQQGNNRHFFRFEFISRRPDNFLLTILDPLGRPAFKILCDAYSLKALDYIGRNYYVGSASMENLDRFVPLHIDVKELLSLLSGALSVQPESVQLGGQKKSDEIVSLFVSSSLIVEDSVWRLSLKNQSEGINPESITLLEADFGPMGKPNLQIRYKGHQDLPREDKDGLLEPFPLSITAKWSSGVERQMVIRYSEVRLGSKLPDNVFVLEAPQNYQLMVL